MIRYIKGILSIINDNNIVVETSSGLGFEIQIASGSPFYKYGEGDEIMVFTDLIVREDDMKLYGFHNRESLDLFHLLTSVSGIGPKGAMAILGSMTGDDLKRAIAFGDVKEVSKAQGVGKKTAERIVLELKDKVGAFADFDNTSNVGIKLSDNESLDGLNPRTEAINGLVSLGYSKAEAFDAVSHILEEELSSEEYLRRALKRLF